jgi:hypothetical protein
MGGSGMSTDVLDVPIRKYLNWQRVVDRVNVCLLNIDDGLFYLDLPSVVEPIAVFSVLHNGRFMGHTIAVHTNDSEQGIVDALLRRLGGE